MNPEQASGQPFDRTGRPMAHRGGSSSALNGATLHFVSTQLCGTC